MQRRNFLQLGLGSMFLAACTNEAPGWRAPLVPTVAADDGDPLPPIPARCLAVATAANIEGPFYQPGAPSRSVLASPSDPGERLVLGGSVQSTACAALGAAVIDVWQANARGDYDLEGFRFRGQLTANAQGRWELRTIVPGRYLNGRRYRPAHLHVKVHAAGYAPLTTQLYFAGDPYNEGDPFIDPSLIMVHTSAAGVRHATFDFVLAAT
jgi:protocatechuate 3,4-dioxygenase beta subunit